MKSKNFIYFTFLCTFIFKVAICLANPITPQEAETFAREQGNTLLQTLAENDLQKKYQKIDNMFLNNVDLDYIGRFVIGKYWREMTEEQRQQYLSLFKRYVISTYKGFPLQFEDKITFDITSIRQDGNDVFVTANIIYHRDTGNETFLTEFRMHKPQDKILLLDIKFGESSLILSYRSKFYQMIKSADEDIDWFLEDFELRVNSAEKYYTLPQKDE